MTTTVERSRPTSKREGVDVSLPAADSAIWRDGVELDVATIDRYADTLAACDVLLLTFELPQSVLKRVLDLVNAVADPPVVIVTPGQPYPDGQLLRPLLKQVDYLVAHIWSSNALPSPTRRSTTLKSSATIFSVEDSGRSASWAILAAEVSTGAAKHPPRCRSPTISPDELAGGLISAVVRRRRRNPPGPPASLSAQPLDLEPVSAKLIGGQNRDLAIPGPRFPNPWWIIIATAGQLLLS